MGVGRRLGMLLVLCDAILCRSKLVGAAVIPHGDFAYDPSLVDGKNGSIEVHKAAISTVNWLASLRPDVIVLSTPHGLELSEAFLVYENDHLSGCAELGSDLHNKSFPKYKVCRNLTTLSKINKLILSALEPPNPTLLTGVRGFADSLPLPISWGEIIPTSFLPDSYKGEVSVISIPYSRYNHSVEMIPDIIQLGRSIGEILHQEDLRVGIMISSDLAHTHLKDGPYGFCDCAEAYDKAVGKWGNSMNSTYIRQQAANQQTLGAKSCGFTGMIFLDGILDVIRKESGEWESQCLANFHPTYYGMMVARFGHGLQGLSRE